MVWTTAAKKISKLRSRVRIIQGGTSAGKTYSILQCLIFYALNKPLHISIVSESVPHLRRGVLKDFIKLMAEANLLRVKEFNKTTLTYTFENGSIMEFFSADQPDKLRGARRDILFINEANNIPYDAYLQLEVRTSKFIYLDFNPTSFFWVHEELIPQDGNDFIKLTYKDNEALAPEIVKSIEAKKNNTYWFTVYGLGEVGVLEGTIFKNWREGDFDTSLPFGYGMDFGYSVDPTALVKVAVDSNAMKLYVKECIYSKGLSYAGIIERLKIVGPNDLIIADSSDPRMIDEIARAGYNIQPCVKGADSVKLGITKIEDYEIIVTPESHNVKKELNNYVWNDKKAGIPVDKYNHTIDAVRYIADRLTETSDFYVG